MRQEHRWNRREFLEAAVLAGTGALLGLQSTPATAEPPPETTRIRFPKTPSICVAPQYLVTDLLKAEGFTDVQHIWTGQDLFGPKPVASGAVDFALNFAGPLLIPVDAGEPIVMLAGGHVGCFELFATDRVRAIRDLKGKTVSVIEHGGPDHVFLASMIAYVGLDPRKDVNWIVNPFKVSTELLAAGKIDAVLAFPPQPQELRAKKIGHVIASSVKDRPWSSYFCCMVYSNRQFVRKYPVATKRVLRAMLKAADLCSLQPERSARALVDGGFTASYDYALQTMTDLPYNKWRDYDPEDTVRFYALRLHEAGMIKSSPQKIIAQGTDWRFIKELKKELKA